MSYSDHRRILKLALNQVLDLLLGHNVDIGGCFI